MTGWVHAVLDLPAGDAGAAAFWSAALGWPLGVPWPEHPELATFTPPAGRGYVHRQLLGDGPAGVHLDLEVPDLPAAADRLTALGATPVRDTGAWHTLRSPSGLAFCLVPEQRSGERPAPVSGPDGVRRRLVQVCLDLPAVAADTEAAFWRAVLPWPEVGLGSPEFLGRLVPPSGSPLQVLLQRLGEDDGATAPRVHLDLGSDDLHADADRLVALGATALLDGDGFVALRDPAGTAFCVTANSPDAP